MITEKQKYAINKIISNMPDDLREIYREIAEYAISLGYMPTIKGVNETYADFSKSKVKRTILKIDTDPNFPPRLAMKFFAIPVYSAIFQEALRERINVLERLKCAPVSLSCGGCGKCDGTHGYYYTYPDGRKVFLCGMEVITVPSFCADNISEVKEALKTQDEFFMEHISK